MMSTIATHSSNEWGAHAPSRAERGASPRPIDDARRLNKPQSGTFGGAPNAAREARALP